jgi:fructose-bisphosphate aldolase class II/tagatose 1,6-diphosphate aldolase GatY/KbaY
MMKLQEKLATFGREHRALLAVNFYNAETLAGILMAASKLEQPVILQLSESTLKYLGLKVAAAIAKAAIGQYAVEAWLHLDHGSSEELAKQCLDEGFDSVMIDASEKSFEENVRITSRVVKMAESYGANVEAELGFVAKLGQDQQTGAFTQPEEAKLFAELTGINALAVAIGSAHGFYKSTPVLQFGLLAEIRQATPVALVLHGSSGIPDEQIRQAINAGINKVNLATEAKNIFMKTLQKTLASTDEIDLRKVFPVAIDAVEWLIAGKMELVGSRQLSS